MLSLEMLGGLKRAEEANLVRQQLDELNGILSTDRLSERRTHADEDPI
jgi:hypothetical protein